MLASLGSLWSLWTLLLFSLVSGSVTDLQPRAPIAKGLDLRVLPIGDSITFGAGDPDYNGYRKTLREALTGRGNKVEFVGSITSGTFSNNQHEGHRGKVISEIADMSTLGIYSGANIVLVHAGTNDMNQNRDVTNAPARLRSLIDLILKNSPDALVLVCQIVPSTTAKIQARIDNFNPHVPRIVDDLAGRGKHVMLVKMNEALTTADLKDNLHPNVGGYKKMANAYYDAIVKADNKGWIKKAGKSQKPPPSGTKPNACRATPSWYNVGKIAQGAKVSSSPEAYGDKAYKPAWTNKGEFKKGTCNRDQLHFMDLDGDGRKDYACVDKKSGKTSVYLNKESGWEDVGVVATGATVKDGKGVMFADLNGDGRDDFIYVDKDKDEVTGWINQGKKQGGDWMWQRLGKIAGGVGATPENLRLVDLDGDGRDDFCTVRYDGAVTGWLNRGPEAMPRYHKIGKIATGRSVGKDDKVIMGDFTGQGRADFMIVGEGGKTLGLVNKQSESGLAPEWLPVFTLAEGPSGAKQEEVRFADLTGNGKVDYLLVDKKGTVRLWQNNGSGGSSQAGDGVFLCDLDGDGAMDYFWVNDSGKGWGYLNKGKGRDKWQPLGQIAKGHHPRQNVRMAVMTLSGRADYMDVNQETGRTVWYRNLGSGQGWNWGPAREIATGPKGTIERKYGWRFDARNVHFADLDGDGLADYLYVNEKGAVIMWRNRGSDPPDWHPDVLVADGPRVGVNGRNIQFGDTNGNGRADYVEIDPVSGRARTWYNQGFRSDGSISWNAPLNFADGTRFPGKYIKLADMTGDGRADYVAVEPNSAALYLWHNRCWEIPDTGGGGGGGGGGGSEKCTQDPEKPDSWESSGAASAVDKFLAKNGRKVNNQQGNDRYYWMQDWLRAADNHFRGFSNSNLFCGDPTTDEKCSAPTADKCPNYPPEWWYAMNMLANVHALFQHSHHAMVTQSIYDLSKLDQMAVDFKTEPPKPSELAQVLSNIATVLGFTSFVTGKAGGQLGADVFSVLQTAVLFGNANKPVKSEADDVEKVVAGAKALVGDILKRTTQQLASTLEAFYGGGNPGEVEKVFRPLMTDKSNNYQSLIGKVLAGGELMKPVTKSTVNKQIQAGIDGMTAATLGRLLAGLHYGVVAGQSTKNLGVDYKKVCDETPDSARFIDGECLYLVRRPKGKSSSENVPKDVIKRIEDYYKIPLPDLLRTVRKCRNNQPKEEIYTGSDKYAPCLFGMNVIEGSNFPFWRSKDGELKNVPDWMQSFDDKWNDHRKAMCKHYRDQIQCVGI